MKRYTSPFIDDATSKFVWLEFAKSESFHALATATKRPGALYVDRAISIVQAFSALIITTGRKIKKLSFSGLWKSFLLSLYMQDPLKRKDLSYKSTIQNML